MAGTKTRFGYFGSSGDDPPGTGEAAAARTVIGHDIHLPQGPHEIAPASTPAPPSPSEPVHGIVASSVIGAVATPMTEAITAAIPERSGHRPRRSRFAGFLGRWTTGGHFRSSRTTDAAEVTEDDLKLPRETAARNVLLVLAVAALTFLITFTIMKWREPHTTAPLPEPPARMAARPLIPTVPASAAPTAPAPATSAPFPPTAATPEPKVATPLVPTVRALRPHKSVRAPKSASAIQPPAHLQDELLPLDP